MKQIERAPKKGSPGKSPKGPERRRKNYLQLRETLNDLLCNPRTHRAARALFSGYFDSHLYPIGFGPRRELKGIKLGGITAVFTDVEKAMGHGKPPGKEKMRELQSYLHLQSSQLCACDAATWGFIKKGGMERLVLLLGRAKAELSEARKAEGGKNAYAIPLQSVDSRIGDCRQGVLISSDFREMSLLFEGIDKLCDCSLEDEFAEISEEFFDEYRQCRKMQGKLASP